MKMVWQCRQCKACALLRIQKSLSVKTGRTKKHVTFAFSGRGDGKYAVLLGTVQRIQNFCQAVSQGTWHSPDVASRDQWDPCCCPCICCLSFVRFFAPPFQVGRTQQVNKCKQLLLFVLVSVHRKCWLYMLVLAYV